LRLVPKVSWGYVVSTHIHLVRLWNGRENFVLDFFDLSHWQKDTRHSNITSSNYTENYDWYCGKLRVIYQNERFFYSASHSDVKNIKIVPDSHFHSQIVIINHGTTLCNLM
jgi:hypothetical protein